MGTLASEERMQLKMKVILFQNKKMILEVKVFPKGSREKVIQTPRVKKKLYERKYKSSQCYKSGGTDHQKLQEELKYLLCNTVLL